MPLVWVVEDNDQNFELVEFLLGDADWRIRRARDRREFASLLSTEPPRIVLLDMNLPDASGLELLADLRTRAELARVPVVAVTAHAMRGDRERFLAAGCDGYVAKPIDARRLLQVMQELIEERG